MAAANDPTTLDYSTSPSGVTVALREGEMARNAIGSMYDDLILGNSQNNLLDGRDGTNQIWGGGGEDTLVGGSGRNAFWWGRGDGHDVVQEAAGHVCDVLYLYNVAWSGYTAGRDSDDLRFALDDGSVLAVRGWYSQDTRQRIQGFVFANRTVAAWNDGAGVEVNLYDPSYAGNNIHQVQVFDSGPSVLRGTDGGDTLIGGSGNDMVNGGAGDDVVRGGDGNDMLWGITGNDALYGGGGNDMLWGDTGDDLMEGEDGNDIMWGDTGDDWMKGGEGNDAMWGGTGDDLMEGGNGNDLHWGDTGDDLIVGGDGDDMIGGGTGDDFLNGGNGSDQIWGNTGNDRLAGGGGADSYWFGLGDGTDTIVSDSQNSEDAVVLSNMADPLSVRTVFSGNHLLLRLESGDTLVLENWKLGGGYRLNRFQTGSGNWHLSEDGGTWLSG